MNKYLEDEMTEKERQNWEEKRTEPVKAFDLSEEEIKKLKKQGKI